MGRDWKRIAPDADTAPVPYPTESHQRTEGAGDQPGKLYGFLGQPTARADDGRRLCADAGDPPGSCYDFTGQSAGLDHLRTAAETRCAGGLLGAPPGHSSAGDVSLEDGVPEGGSRAGRYSWISENTVSLQPN